MKKLILRALIALLAISWCSTLVFAAGKPVYSETTRDVLVINNNTPNIFKIALDSFYYQAISQSSQKNSQHLLFDTLLLVPQPDKSPIGTILYIVLPGPTKPNDVVSAEVVLEGGRPEDSLKNIVSYKLYGKNGVALDINTKGTQYVFGASKEAHLQKWSFQHMTSSAFKSVNIQIGNPPYAPCGTGKNNILDISDNISWSACGYYSKF